MMRKWMLALLCMVLTVSLVTTSACAENRVLLKQDAEEADRTYLHDMMTVGDALILPVRNTLAGNVTLDLYRWTPGMEDAEKTASGLFLGDWLSKQEEVDTFVTTCEQENGVKLDAAHMISQLFTDGERLMAYNLVTGLVFAIRTEDGKAVYEDIATMKDTSFLFHMEGEERWPAGVRSVAVADNRVYFLVRDYDATHEFTRIAGVDLATGEQTVYKQEFVHHLVQGKDGQLMTVSRDDRNAYDSKTNTMAKLALSVWNPETDTATQVGELDSTDSYVPLTYSKELDALVYLDNFRVMCVQPGGESKQVGYLPQYYANVLCVVGDSVAVRNSDDPSLGRVMLRTISKDYNENDRLLVYGGGNMAATRLFAERYPQVPVYSGEFNGNGSGLSALGQAMAAGEKAPDVLTLSIAYMDFDTLMRKGYCEDLSGDAEIAGYVARMYPVLQDAVSRDGKIFAVPMNAYSYDGWYMAKGVAEEMGLEWDDIPKNLADLCAFITRWNDEWVDEYPQFAPMEYTENYKATILRYMLEGYMNECQAEGRDVRFNTPEFQTMMAALDAMRTEKLEKGVARENEDEVGYRQGLFMYNYGLVGNFDTGDSEYRRLVPMTLREDAPFRTGVDMTVIFVNPKSNHKEAALNYIKCMQEAQDKNDPFDPFSVRTLMADAAEPLKNPYYDQMIKNEENWLKQLEKKLTTADEAEKKEIQSSIDMERKWLENAEKNYYYSISPEAMDFYRQTLAPAMYVRKPTLLYGADSQNEELNTLIERYLAGQIKVDQFIKNMDSKLQMMQMEDW